MAYTEIVMQNPATQAVKSAPIGFSWTVLFFGFLPPLFRGDIKWGLIILLFWLLSAGLTNIVFSFIYNKLFVKEMMAEGYCVHPVQDEGMKTRVLNSLGFFPPEYMAPQ